MEVFKIWGNRKRDKIRTTSITVQGTCCWEISHRLGDKQELCPDQNYTPTISYIRKLRTKKCGCLGKIRASH